MAQPFTATRYHSLAIMTDTLPEELLATAWVDGSSGRIVMAVRHRDLPLHGVQFHPESVLTEGGHRMFANWLEMCGLTGGNVTKARTTTASVLSSRAVSCTPVSFASPESTSVWKASCALGSSPTFSDPLKATRVI